MPPSAEFSGQLNSHSIPLDDIKVFLKFGRHQQKFFRCHYGCMKLMKLRMARIHASVERSRATSRCMALTVRQVKSATFFLASTNGNIDWIKVVRSSEGERWYILM